MNKDLINQCSICSSLKDEEYAEQKYGWPEDDTFLPPAAAKLIVVKDFTHGSRKNQLQQCPECNTYYHYRTDYEYIVNGTEDEQYLKRLSSEEASEFLEQKG